MLAAYLLWNLTAFLLVMLDKSQARRGRRRIPERYFFLFALLFGAAGILTGMYIFRHKTRHASFVFGVPLLLLLNVVIYFFLINKL